MEAIKRWLDPKKRLNKKSKRTLKVSPPVSGRLETLTDWAAELPERRGGGKVGIATTRFTPQDRGRAQTLAWLERGTSDALESVLNERDRAAGLVHRGPRTKGTKEVQLILRQPSRRRVEQLHRVRRQTEMAVRYGAPGAAYYNFSRSVSWNRAAAPRLPAIQLRDFGTMMRKVGSRMPAVPFTPTDWLDLPKSEAAAAGGEDCQPLSPVTEEGGWGEDTAPADLERPESRIGFVRGDDDDDNEGSEDVADREETGFGAGDNIDAELDPYDDLSDGDGTIEDEWEAREAKILTMVGVPPLKVRKLYVKPKHKQPLELMLSITEVSTPEEASSDGDSVGRWSPPVD